MAEPQWQDSPDKPGQVGWYLVECDGWDVPRLYWAGSCWAIQPGRSEIWAGAVSRFAWDPNQGGVATPTRCGDIGHADPLAGLYAPTPEAIRAARTAAGHSQADAAKLAGLGDAARWSSYERTGKTARNIDLSRWALYLLATGQHPALKLSQKG